MTAKEAKEGTVLVGRKAASNYVFAALNFFEQGYTKVVFKARGRAITTAVNAVELLKRLMKEKVEVGQIKIGTEQRTDQSGVTRPVSFIEIPVTLKKK